MLSAQKTSFVSWRLPVRQSQSLIIIGSVARCRNEALACSAVLTIERSLEAVRGFFGGIVMSQAVDNDERPSKLKLTSDGWAVLVALALAALVRIGVIHRVPW